MDPITILGGVIAFLLVITPIIATYYSRVAKFLTVIQLFLDLYREYLVSAADREFTETEYAEMGRDFEKLATYVDQNINIDAWIEPKK